MKFIVALFALFALVQLGHSRSLRPVHGLQLFATLGKYAFDRIENGTLKIAVRKNIHGRRFEQVFPFEPAALYPGSWHFQLMENVTNYSFENANVFVFFQLNHNSTTKMAANPVITVHHINTITFNQTSGQYSYKYFYPENFAQEIGENERMFLRPSNSQ